MLDLPISNGDVLGFCGWIFNEVEVDKSIQNIPIELIVNGDACSFGKLIKDDDDKFRFSTDKFIEWSSSIIKQEVSKRPEIYVKCVVNGIDYKIAILDWSIMGSWELESITIAFNSLLSYISIK